MATIAAVVIWTMRMLVVSILSRPPLKPPRVLLVLGGSADRERRAADLERCGLSQEEIASLELVILSSGALDEKDLRQAFIEERSTCSMRQRPLDVLADRSATCTVTNFTTLADEFSHSPGAKTIAVATSRLHCARASAVGSVVLGSRGVRIARMLAIDARDEPQLRESLLRTVRDLLRALLWATIGYDLSALGALIHPVRTADSKRWLQQSTQARTQLRAALMALTPQ